MTKKNNNKKQELKLVIFSFDSPQPTGPRNNTLPLGLKGWVCPGGYLGRGRDQVF